MGLFDKKKEIPRSEFWKAVKGYKGQVPHTWGKKFSWIERKKLAKEAVSPYGREGSIVQHREVGAMFRRLERERKDLKREASKQRLGGKFKESKELSKEAERLKQKMQVLGRIVGGRHGKRYERRKNW